MLRHLMAVLCLVLFTAPLAAQEAQTEFEARPPVESTAPPVDRTATGGAQTLEDILRRQRGLPVDDSFRRGNDLDEPAAVPQLGPLGGASDSDFWRALRYNEANVNVSTAHPAGGVLVQDNGMWWLELREGPLRIYGGWLLLGTIGLLAVFFLLRGTVRIEGGKAGRTVTRFKAIERFAHWMMAGSFLLLAFTGLFTLFGRKYFIGWFGLEFNSQLLIASKFIHNNVAWAFMLGLLMVFVMWVWHNLPDRTDLTWFRYGGGIIGKKHPPAKKFNAGQKIVFWSVILFGASVSVSGLSLLFPFELPLFDATFRHLNDWGVYDWVGLQPFPTALSPQEEMQYAQLWHAIVGFVLMAVIIGHIYIGTLGMEGAYDAMGSGQVDENWAEQHHSLWLDKVKEREAGPETPAQPAE
ncbi:MAG: formate dehydrogenase subunit gamma [Marinovum algicola]|jgi:formate dehydrogenase subunit gamma|uniref:Formate dehydrogenase gamma subunit n=1 Tax=Marinovum algicola TaxID=42444 RepID=A0A975WD92_9RHOB|nr:MULTISPECIES: formate dehydrogenase subunit gamma [Marinovum]MDD9739454.1 formate dehydrogenase subunit gamma [Marinovum sp. SP66]MDD9744860.1 formate dehydrogenase subunit gamma [Marinovum sp. PR37]SEJ98706.1 formate dehydrogenase gamma subunit [Marinovum algicola]SLN70627.1 Formate dehydrogenase, nitrate-inducible, cytochrome b556(Fdn) subunit [Marinovum algicola]